MTSNNNNNQKGLLSPFWTALLSIVIILVSVTYITDILHISFLDLIILAVCFRLLPLALLNVLRFIFCGADKPQKEPSNPQNP